MNVYIVELSRQLATRGVEVEIFTRATSSELPPTVSLAPGVLVRHITAGPYEGLRKDDLPAQLCAFTAGLMRVEAAHEPGHYDAVHSHYWLSGQVGWVAAERWAVPLVHTAHTLAKVKNSALAEGDAPEPAARVIGEAAGGRRLDPAHRQHPGRGGSARSSSMTPRSPASMSSRPAWTSRCSVRARRRPLAPGSECLLMRQSCCSSGACSR